MSDIKNFNPGHEKSGSHNTLFKGVVELRKDLRITGVHQAAQSVEHSNWRLFRDITKANTNPTTDITTHNEPIRQLAQPALAEVARPDGPTPDMAKIYPFPAARQDVEPELTVEPDLAPFRENVVNSFPQEINPADVQFDNKLETFVQDTYSAPVDKDLNVAA